MSEQRLGRGLKFLLSGGDSVASQQEVDMDRVLPNRLQPRKRFDPKAIAELAASIRVHGILQPIVVRKISDDRFEIIAGERRFRAAREAGLSKVPVTVKEIGGDRESLELAMIENLQREDLDPIEKSKGYKQLADTFGLTQEKIAERMGQDRSTIANFLRLLELPEEIQQAVSRGTLSFGHARALLGISTKEAQIKAMKQIEEKGLSVRDVESLVGEQKGLLVISPAKRSRTAARPAWLNDIESGLQRRLGMKVRIHRGAGGRGRVSIEFSSDSELEKIDRFLGRPSQ